MSDKLSKLLATFFYMGDFPVAPGTLASFAGVLIYGIIYEQLWLHIILTIIISAVGFVVCGKTERILKQKDASCIVIDEVAGMLIALFMLPPAWPIIVTAFFLFRAFDMFKIYPVGLFERLEGSTGVMMDDIVAGLYTNIIMHIAIRLMGVV